jgi:hypothetical protein
MALDRLAIGLLEKLLTDGERQQAGRRSRAASLSGKQLDPYRALRSLREREEFQATMQAAANNGAVALTFERGFHDQRNIERVEIRDLEALAAFIGRPTRGSMVDAARQVLQLVMDEAPVLEAVIARWAELRPVRGTKPEEAGDWLDAMKVIRHMAAETAVCGGDLPIREVSARLFRDSKRIEALTAILDVLLSGSVDGAPRENIEIWKELGLCREEQPVRLAGAVTLRRTRVTAMLDAPYGAFHASSVLGIEGVPERVLSIENQTTFHQEALRRQDENVLLIYTAGMPSPAWRAMYEQLIRSIPDIVPLLHWGDVDEGGFRIAANLAKAARAAGRVLRPYRMSPEDVPESMRKPATEGTLKRIRTFASEAGWEDLGSAVAEAGFTAEQEALDLASPQNEFTIGSQ